MSEKEKEILQRILNTLETSMPVMSVADMDAKLGICMVITDLIAGKYAEKE